MLTLRLSREASMALLPRLLARRAAPLRVALAARLALPAQRVLSTSAPSEPAAVPASKPSTLRSTMWDLFLRFSGFNSQESKDDRFAMMAMMKCHKHAQSPEFREVYGVVPTFHGTFQLTGLHVWMCHVRLRLEDPRRANHVAAELFEHWWHQTMLDMKEAGVHDFLQISSNLKEVQQGFRGSAKAYDDALKAEDTMGVMRAALWRNVYFSEKGKEENAVKLSHYVEKQLLQLMSMKSEAFMSPEPGSWAFSRPTSDDPVLSSPK